MDGSYITILVDSQGIRLDKLSNGRVFDFLMGQPQAVTQPGRTLAKSFSYSGPYKSASIVGSHPAVSVTIRFGPPEATTGTVIESWAPHLSPFLHLLQPLSMFKDTGQPHNARAVLNFCLCSQSPTE